MIGLYIIIAVLILVLLAIGHAVDHYLGDKAQWRCARALGAGVYRFTLLGILFVAVVVITLLATRH